MSAAVKVSAGRNRTGCASSGEHAERAPSEHAAPTHSANTVSRTLAHALEGSRPRPWMGWTWGAATKRADLAEPPAVRRRRSEYFILGEATPLTRCLGPRIRHHTRQARATNGRIALVVRLFVRPGTQLRQLVGVGIGAAAEEAVVVYTAQMVQRNGQTCCCLGKGFSGEHASADLLLI